MNNAGDLIVPVYLNQRVVFDLVATMQGGLAAVTKVAEVQQVSGMASAEASSGFGLANVLSSLLKIDFSGKAAGKIAGDISSTRSEDRIHTPASLFTHLRTLIRDKHWLQVDSPTASLFPGTIFEFTAKMEPNPLIKSLDTFIEMVEMAQVFSEPTKKGKSQAGSQNDFNKMKRQMQAMSSAMKSGTTSDLITGKLECGSRCVITLEKQFLNDTSMSDLVDGTFRVVGKVIRTIDECDSISLNRNTAIGCLPDQVLAQLQNAFASPELAVMHLPPLEWKISGPAIQVLPVAIFA